MSRTGSCLDNAVAEAWFASLKVELVDRAHYRTRAEARAAIFAWIAWYNRFRLHSTRGYLPPIEWEQQHATINPLPSTMAANDRSLRAGRRVGRTGLAGLWGGWLDGVYGAGPHRVARLWGAGPAAVVCSDGLPLAQAAGSRASVSK